MTAELAKKNPEEFIKSHLQIAPLIIDEVQYAPEILRYLKLFIDESRDEMGRFLLTGSQNFLMMRDISESLAGRISVLSLYPLSTSELREYTEIDESFIVKGGYPEIWAQNISDLAGFYEDYIATYLQRDIRALINVTDLVTFDRFLRLLALRVGNLINYSSLANDVGVSPNTIKNWLNALETSCIISALPPFFTNLGKTLIKTPKIYFNDHGLLCHLIGITDLAQLMRSNYVAQIWENLIFCELVKTQTVKLRNLYFYRDKANTEVDFIYLAGNKAFLIEAKFAENPKLELPQIKEVAQKMLASKLINATEISVACRSPVEGTIMEESVGVKVWNPLKSPFNI